MKKTVVCFVILLIFGHLLGIEVTEPKETNMDRLEWFKNAKLGIFIHWGIYSVNGIDESWSFYNNYIPYEDYMSQLSRFTAKKYKPHKWAKLIKNTGAQYAVLTAKHHDGVALWDTKLSNLNVIEKTPAQRDLVGPFCEALRDQDIKVGLYYSLIDWSDDRYPNFKISEKRYEDEPERWDEFVKFYQGQIEELSTQYNPDLYWFDGDWERTAEQWQAKELKEKLLQWNPNVIVNSRLQGYGDYATPEQGVPISKPESEAWELCLTMNDSWGYQPFDTNYKTPYQIIRIFIDCISKGGNLLLDIGPKADGTIPDEQVAILKELARWNKKHHEAVFESIEGISTKYTDYPTTLSKDRKTLYLFYPHLTLLDPIRIKGLVNSIENCSTVGQKGSLPCYKLGNNLFINSISSKLDPQVTVIKIQLDSEIELSDDFNYSYNCLSRDKAQNPPGSATMIGDYIDIISSEEKDDSMLDVIEVLVNRDFDYPSSSSPPEFTVKRWLFKHQEAFTNPQPGLPEGYFNGRTSLSENRDILYLYLQARPKGPLVLKGIKNKINRIRVVGTGVKLSWKVFNKLYWSDVPGIVYINLPLRASDSSCTVIAVQLDGEIELQE